MEKVWIAACALLFVSIAGLAQTPSPTSTSLSSEALTMILGESAPTGLCAPKQDEALFVAQRPRNAQEKAACTATAACGSSTTVTCQDNTLPANCTAVDRNCSVGQRGYVMCDGVRKDCPCPCGTIQQQTCCMCDQTGDCMQCCRCAGGTISQCGVTCG